MNDKVIAFKRELERELNTNINLLCAIDKVNQKGKAIELDGRVQALQWALDTLIDIMTK